MLHAPRSQCQVNRVGGAVLFDEALANGDHLGVAQFAPWELLVGQVEHADDLAQATFDNKVLLHVNYCAYVRQKCLRKGLFQWLSYFVSRALAIL